MVYRLIKTTDNSYTFFNEKFGDVYHNKEGALSEAHFSFLKPLEKFLKEENKFIVFDIGFGLGYNAFLIKEFLIKEEKDFILFSFEKDLGVINLIKRNLDLLPNKEKNKEYKKFFEKVVFLKENEKLKDLKNRKHYLLLGDAKKRVLEVKKLIEGRNFFDYYKIVLHDGFSPIKNKDLWTFEFLSTFFNFEVFITYTNHVKVRSSLLLNDFYLFKTKAFNRKDGGTLALGKKLFKKIEYNEIKRLFEFKELEEKELVFLLTPYSTPFSEFLKFKNTFLFSSKEVKKESSNFKRFREFLKKKRLFEKERIIKDLLCKNLFLI